MNSGLNSKLGAKAEEGPGFKVCPCTKEKSVIQSMLQNCFKLLNGFFYIFGRFLAGFIFTDVNKGFALNKALFQNIQLRSGSRYYKNRVWKVVIMELQQYFINMVTNNTNFVAVI